MTTPSKPAYGIAAACFAVVLQKSAEPQWWDAHWIIGLLIGISIPVCVLAAWLAETHMRPRSVGFFRFVPHSAVALGYAAWAGIIVGLLALMLFLLTVSLCLAIGFGLGSFLLGQFIDMTTPNA